MLPHLRSRLQELVNQSATRWVRVAPDRRWQPTTTTMSHERRPKTQEPWDQASATCCLPRFLRCRVVALKGLLGVPSIMSFK